MPSGVSPQERSLLEAWLKRQPAVAVSRRTIPRRADIRSAPASHGQQQIWIHSQLAGAQVIYNEPVTLHYHGEFNIEVFRKSLSAFIQRHEAWRTTFAFQNGMLRQNIHPTMDVTIPFNDLSAVPESKREQRAVEMARKDALLPFDLMRGPLLRGRLIRFHSSLHRAYLCLHHIIFDGVSLYNIFLPELAAMYGAYSAGTKPALPECDIQYADYAEWNNRRIHSGELDPQAEYWERQLKQLAALEFPTDRPRSKHGGFRGAMHRFFVSKTVAQGLLRIGQQENATLFMVLTAVLAAQVKLWAGADDIPIGGASSTRRWSEIENVVGFFLNTLVFRIDGSGDPTFREFLARVRQTVLAAVENDEVPFTDIVRNVRRRVDTSRHPLFQIMFSLEPPLPALQPGWEFTQMDVETGTTKFDLHLEMDERPDGILARFFYNTDLFERHTIEQMAEQWLELASQVIARSDSRLSELTVRKSATFRERIWQLFPQVRSSRRQEVSCGRRL